MAGGVLGTFHHLYFAGTTTGVVALGASFSALEVVPLALIGMEAYETWSHSKATPWMARYRWPIMFFIAVSFWNLVGAGLFGFLINTRSEEHTSELQYLMRNSYAVLCLNKKTK